jgi:hypothetical protein
MNILNFKNLKNTDSVDIKVKENFLLESIKDIQNTIKGLDVKIGFLLIFLCAPFSKFENINSAIPILVNKSNLFSFFILALFTIWLFVLWLLFTALSPKNNPTKSIDFTGSKEPKGFFFGGYLESPISFWNGCKSSYSRNLKNNFDSEIQYLKTVTDNIYIEELMFERLKLVTIRNLKLQRISICITAIRILIIIAVFLFISYLLVK